MEQTSLLLFLLYYLHPSLLLATSPFLNQANLESLAAHPTLLAPISAQARLCSFTPHLYPCTPYSPRFFPTIQSCLRPCLPDLLKPCPSPCRAKHPKIFLCTKLHTVEWLYLLHRQVQASTPLPCHLCRRAATQEAPLASPIAQMALHPVSTLWN